MTNMVLQIIQWLMVNSFQEKKNLYKCFALCNICVAIEMAALTGPLGFESGRNFCPKID